MQSLVVYFTHLSLVLSVRYGLITASRSLQAKGEMCTLQTRKLCYHAVNISGGSWGGATGDPGPHFSTKMRPEPSPPSPSPPYLKVWIRYWISITSLCLCICRIARELTLSSVMVFRKGVCRSLHTAKATLRCAQDKSTKLWELHYTPR